LAFEPRAGHLLRARDAPPPHGDGTAMSRLAPRPQPDRPPGRTAAPPTAGLPPGAAALPPPLPHDDPINRLPLLVLYPHSRCNCRCLMCDIWRDRGKRELAAVDVARWLPEWRRLGVERVVLSGGEALLHTELWPLCDLLRGAGIGITLLSTGLLLARDAARLVAVCDDVVVSLDGPRQVHDRIRNVPRAFDRLAAGVGAVRAAGVAAVRAAGGTGTRISGRCTVQRANFHALRATVAAARDVGLERLSFLAADVTSEAFNRPGGWDRERAAEVALREEDLEPLAAELAALAREHAADFASGFLAESPRKLERRLLQHFAALLGRAEFAPNVCNAPWVSAVIETDGTVRPCFFQPPLGNLHAPGGLAAILNSPSAIAWRRGLDVARDAICRRCVCSLCLRQGVRP
ncbi:MAG TPA: radical SAM protein, partial [Thermoanaerobaculia bacterium]|nr:radical SAM protein [Thermoanaerobaculia bacterium]